jgi:hypothetical protein
MKYTYTLLFIFIINNFSRQPSENKHKRIKSTNKNTVIKLSEDSLHSTFLIETPVKDRYIITHCVEKILLSIKEEHS